MKLRLQYFGGRGSGGGKSSGGGLSKPIQDYSVKELSSMDQKTQAMALNEMPSGTVIYIRRDSKASNQKFTKMENGKWATNSWEDTPKSWQSSKAILQDVSTSAFEPEATKNNSVNFYRVLYGKGR